MAETPQSHSKVTTPVARTRWTPRQVALSLMAGTLAGVIHVGLLSSLAALIFAGPLVGFLVNGIGLLLVGACLFNLLLPLLGSRPAIVAAIQDAPAVVIALIAAAVAAAVPAAAGATALYATVIATIALATLLTSAAFLLLGQLRLGTLVTYMPYPVVGGFLAGTGWLLLVGGLDLMTDLPASPDGLPALFQPQALWQWLPGLLFAGVLLLALRHSRSVLTLPALLLGGIALFYGWLTLAGIPLAEAEAGGLLLGPFPEQVPWAPLTPQLLGAVQWPVLLGQLGAMGAVVAISVLGLLLNVSGLQLARREESDLNRELRAAGIAQLATGLIGCPPGYQALSMSMIGPRMGANTRLVSVTAGLVAGAAFFFGAEILSLMPRLILGGLVCYLGLSFLTEWLYDAWFRLTRLDYAVVVLITALIAGVGILTGVVVGLVVAVALFVLAYSRVDAVKYVLSGNTARSRVTRSGAEQALLRQQGEQIAVFQLQGFLFFGTANALVERVRTRVLGESAAPLRFVVLDFRLVPGLDSTATFSFARLQQLAVAHELTLVLTQLAAGVRRQLERAFLHGEGARNVMVLPDLDRGLEWCENALLAADSPAQAETGDLRAQLARIVPEATNLDELLGALERRLVAPGEHLIRPDQPPDDMYFVESGQVTAQIPGEGGTTVRLERMGGGRTVGELGFYLGRRRTAAVIADEPSSVYRVTRESLRRLEQEHPAAAATLHLIIARLVSERAVHLIETVDALQR